MKYVHTLPTRNYSSRKQSFTIKTMSIQTCACNDMLATEKKKSTIFSSIGKMVQQIIASWFIKPYAAIKKNNLAICTDWTDTDHIKLFTQQT